MHTNRVEMSGNPIKEVDASNDWLANYKKSITQFFETCKTCCRCHASTNGKALIRADGSGPYCHSCYNILYG